MSEAVRTKRTRKRDEARPTMLIPVLGTVASASTWVFNSVRGMLAAARPGAVALYTERADELLANIPSGRVDVVIKAHSLDVALMRLCQMTDTRLILTLRDPKDSVVSQMDRFGFSLHQAVDQLSQTYATFAAIEERARTLVLRYEDGFTADRGTFDTLADYLDVRIAAPVLDALFEASRPDRVRKTIEHWVADARAGGVDVFDPATDYDPITQWHPNHVGDGISGKWRGRLSVAQAEAVAQAFPCDFLGGAWTGLPILWSPLLFRYDDEREPKGASETIVVAGSETLCVHGPGLRLPAGRWRVLPRLAVAPGTTAVTVKLDVMVRRAGRGVVQLRTVTLPEAHDARIALDFDHVDPRDPIEVRLTSVADGRRAALVFSGVELTWLGPLHQSGLLAAQPVG